MTDDRTTPPWNTNPKTIEEMRETIMLLLTWEKENGKSCPRSWCPVFSSRLMGDICHRLLLVEKTVFGG